MGVVIFASDNISSSAYATEEIMRVLLLAGLGNPGTDYARNRHNAGFMAVDVIHESYTFGPWRSRFNGAVSEGKIAGLLNAKKIGSDLYYDETLQTCPDYDFWIRLGSPRIHWPGA